MCFFRQSQPHAVERHLFVPEQLFNASDDFDVGGGVEPPVRAISFGPQLGNLRFPLAEDVNRYVDQFADLGNAVPPVGKLIYCTILRRFQATNPLVSLAFRTNLAA